MRCNYRVRIPSLSKTLLMPGAFLLLGLCCGPVWAMTTYQYEGFNYSIVNLNNTPPAGTYTTDMNLSGQFSVATDLTEMSLTEIGGSLLSYSFFDGRNTLTQANSEIVRFEIAVNAIGEITEWDIQVQDPFPDPGGFFVGVQSFTIRTADGPNWINQGSISECTAINLDNGCTQTMADQATYVGIADNVGTWSVVPLPAGAWLFASALGLLGWMRRQRN
jgi:hypothetical protein